MKFFYSLFVFITFLTPAFASNPLDGNEQEGTTIYFFPSFLQSYNQKLKGEVEIETRWSNPKEIKDFVEKALKELQEFDEPIKAEIGKRILNANDRYNEVNNHPSRLDFKAYSDQIIKIIKYNLWCQGCDLPKLKVNVESIYHLPMTLKYKDEDCLRENIADIAYRESVSTAPDESPAARIAKLLWMKNIFMNYAESVCNLINAYANENVAGPYVENCNSTLGYVKKTFDQLEKFSNEFFEIEEESSRWLYDALGLEKKISSKEWAWYKTFWWHEIDTETQAVTHKKSSEFGALIEEKFWLNFNVLLAELYYQGFSPDDLRALTDPVFYENRKTPSYINILLLINNYANDKEKIGGVYSYFDPERILEAINNSLDNYLAPKVEEFVQRSELFLQELIEEEPIQEEQEKLDTIFINMSPDARMEFVQRLSSAGFSSIEEQYNEIKGDWDTISEESRIDEELEGFRLINESMRILQQISRFEKILRAPFSYENTKGVIKEIDVSTYAKVLRILSSINPKVRDLFDTLEALEQEIM